RLAPAALGHGAAGHLAGAEAVRPHQRWRALDRPGAGALARFRRHPDRRAGHRPYRLGAAQPGQPPAGAAAAVLGMLARAGHIALYVGLVLMPLTGISIMIGNGYGLKAFGMQLVAPGAEIEWLATFGGVIHSPLAWLLVLLVIGHVAMALWHGLVR